MIWRGRPLPPVQMWHLAGSHVICLCSSTRRLTAARLGGAQMARQLAAEAAAMAVSLGAAP